LAVWLSNERKLKGEFMKNLLTVFAMLLAFASVSFAKLMFVSLDEAVKNSDLIVVGTLKGISERMEDGATYGKGEIFVQQFIAGNVKTINGFKLKAEDRLQLNYVEDFACVMGSYRRIENEKGIFLLTLNNEGDITSKDFRSIESLSEIKNLLKKGVKPKGVFKKIKLQNELEDLQLREINNTSNYNPEVSFGIYSLERKVNYQPILTLLVILVSISLYYLLYRSRFKIR
jgi:hypothetical protein